MMHYSLNRVIGHGGMSTVWLADTEQGPVAVKILRPEFSAAPEFVDRFRTEAESSLKIDNPHVVRTYDYQDSSLVMEYVPGQSLADLLSNLGSGQPLAEDDALNILEQAASGLAAIHNAGLVHRDIKPGNLLLRDSSGTAVGDPARGAIVKITDFGIVKAAQSVALTRTGMVVGTAQYVSPEQAQGFDVTPASDVYSLGVVGFEMLSGSRPFSGDSSVSVALAHISQAPPHIDAPISDAARELISIALRKDPASRYADGAEFAQAIAAVRRGQWPPAPRMINDAPTTVLPSQAPVAGGFVDPHATTHLQQAIGAGAGATVGAGASAQSGAGATAAQRRPQTLNQGQATSARQVTQAKPRKKQSKAIPILVGVLVTALIGATAFILANAFGLIGTTPKPTPTVVTETQITTVPAKPTQAPTPAPAPRPVEPTTPREEPTSTTKSTTTTSTPVDKPDDGRDADTPPSPSVGTTTTPRTPADSDQPGGDTGTTPPAGTVADTNETSPQP